jgi:hypothetical protein
VKKKELRFKELSELAKIKAVYDYALGWVETHDENDLSFYEIIEILNDNNEIYREDGAVFEDQW